MSQPSFDFFEEESKYYLNWDLLNDEQLFDTQ